MRPAYTWASLLLSSLYVMLFLLAPPHSLLVTAQLNTNDFSVQFIPYASGPLDPSESELVDALEDQMNVYLYPTTYSQHVCQLQCQNFTVLCEGASARCTASAILLFAGPNKTAEYDVISSLADMAQLAVDVGVNQIALGPGLYGSAAPLPPPPRSDEDNTQNIIVYAVAVPLGVLVVLGGVWVVLRMYVKRHNSDDEFDDYFQNEGTTPRREDLGEELLTRDATLQA